ncbi:uncharacterized protein LOC135386268 isoform X1 [Ornithodoros turicata]|uniref:uncharacterized protein LOC135386268 isoform X1 n=1 Tax=Ornithodoros turicata TaxID=34597 RepID=UPI003138D3A2
MTSTEQEERLTSPGQDYKEVEFIDPRVQFELERLNTATDLINKLEIELDEARSNFRLLLTESSQKINQLAKKLGSHVDKARPYYDARMRVKELQGSVEKSAQHYERASLAHCAARDMVAMAEDGLRRRSCDPVFQDMLNRATLRVNEAERERVLSRTEHQRLSRECSEEEQRVADMQAALRKSIAKASLSARRSMLQINAIANQHELQLLPYFELKSRLNEALEEQKKRVFQIEEDVMRVKFSYAEALHNLEEISDEMHNSRQVVQTPQGDVPTRLVKSSSLSSSEMLKIYEDICQDDTYMKLPAELASSSWKLRRAFSEDNHSSSCAQSHAEPFRSRVSSLVGRVFRQQSTLVGSHGEGNPRGRVPALKVLVANVVDGMFPEKPVSESTTVSPGNCLSSRKKDLDIPIPLAVPEDLSPMLTPDIDRLVQSARELYLDQASSVLRTVEECSDSESLVSTTGTLDDHQIDCLLLDRVLELDYQDVLNSCRDPSS